MMRLMRFFTVILFAFLVVGNAQAQNSAPPLTQSFYDPSFGYSLRFPASWERDKSQEFAAVFTSAPGKDAEFASIAISLLQSSRPGPPKQAAVAVMQKYLSELDAANLDATLLTNVPFIYRQNNVMIEGAQAVTEFANGVGRLRQWTVVLPRPEGTKVHVWSYTADIFNFDSHMTTVQAMLDSWVLVGDDIR